MFPQFIRFSYYNTWRILTVLHVRCSHTEYEVDGERIMRMKFYIEGPLNKGTAQLEVRKVRAGGSG